ncbi:hypothetical protein LCGC14_2402480, partial [marine sediment metagenome]
MPDNFSYVAAAYAAIWVVLIIYLASMGSRIGKIEKKIDLLKNN